MRRGQPAEDTGPARHRRPEPARAGPRPVARAAAARRDPLSARTGRDHGHGDSLLQRRARAGLRLWLGLVAFCLAVFLVIYIAAIAMSWRASRGEVVPGPWWSRWYGILAALVAITAIGLAAPGRRPRSLPELLFPAESMAPTLMLGDKLIA